MHASLLHDMYRSLTRCRVLPKVPTKIIGRTVNYNRGDLDAAALAGMEAIADEMRGNKPVSSQSLAPGVYGLGRGLCIKAIADLMRDTNPEC